MEEKSCGASLADRLVRVEPVQEECTEQMLLKCAPLPTTKRSPPFPAPIPAACTWRPAWRTH